MSDLSFNILAEGAEHLNIILLMGLAIFFGTIGAGIFQRLRIPRIIGYVTIGIILGPALKIISPETVENLELFNLFALGIIGFLIGGELERDIFVKFGRQVVAILLFEGGVAFLLVIAASFFALHYFTHYDWQISLAMAVVFGAICAATDPASTVNVLWEYKARGPLTTMLTAIVALDDALALVLYPRRSLKSFELVRKFAPPVYVLFFVIIGTRLRISLDGHIWLLAGAYVVGSIVGKTTGSHIGAVYSKAMPSIKKYLGFCLYQQGTIAIALLIMASSRFEGAIRDTMLSVIIIGVFILQLIGPLFVKVGIKKAGEAGLNITEDDLIKTYKVSDVMETDVPVISAGTSLCEVIQVVSDTDNFYYPVVGDDKKLIGGITLSGIRNTFTTQELNDWLVALDIVEPIIAKVNPELALSEAFDKADRLDLGHLPVVAGDENNKYAGVLNCRAVRRQLAAEVLSRQKKADSAAGD